MTRTRFVAIAVAALAAGLGSSFAGEARSAPEPQIVLKPIQHSRVGRVEGTQAFIALSFQRGRLRAYVCDGTARRRHTLSQWLEGAWDGRSPRTLARAGVTLRIEAVEGGGRVRGRLWAFGGPHRFAVVPTTGPAGLYEGRGATWIVLAGRSVRGAMVDPRPKRCVPVVVTGSDGKQEWVVVCR